MNKFKYTLLAGVATSVLTLPAIAQEQPGATSGDDEAANVDEVVVTATRREVKLQDVPAAVLSIDPDTFTSTGKTSISDIIRYEPGLLYQDGGQAGRGTISARGIPQLGSTPVFASYVDDMPLTSNTPYNQGAYISVDGLLLDVERVEIVKGPQGTLFGATSVGGMMRYVTKKPALQEFRGSASIDVNTVDGGGWGEIYNGRISVPVIKDKLGFSFGAFYQETAGFLKRNDPVTGDVIEHNVGGSDIEGYAADLLFQASDAMDIRIKYLRQETDTLDAYTSDLAGLGETDGLFVDYGTVSAPSSGIQLVSEYVSGAINYEFDSFTLSSTSSWSNLEQDINADFTTQFAGLADLLSGRAPGTTTSVTLTSPLTTEKFVQEIRLTSNENDSFEWLIGGYYAEEEGTNIQDAIVLPQPPIELFYADFPSRYKELAGYANVTYYISDDFDIGGGVRVSENDVDFNFFTDGVLSVGFGPAISVDQTTSDSVTTWLGNVRWRPSDNLSLYARIASGYRGPAPNFIAVDPFTGLPLTSPIVESDSAWSYEIGAKGSSDDGKLSYDISAFYIDFSNFQAGFEVNGLGVLGNSDDGLTSKGFDASFTYLPTANLFFKTSFGYVDSSLNSDEPGFGGIGGVQTPAIPKWKGSVQWNYTTDIFSDWTADFGGGVRYIGGFDSAYTFASATAARVDSRVITDVNLAFTKDHVKVGFYVTNLFNERKLTGRLDSIIGVNPVTFDPIYYSTGDFERPRTIGGNVSFSF